MNRWIKSVLLSPIFLTLLSVGALALWVSGISITGNVASFGGGTQPELITNTSNIVVNSEYSNIYNNPDGAVNMDFQCSVSGLISSDSRCRIENGKDYHMEISFDGGSTYSDCSDPVASVMSSGENRIFYRVVSDQYACPLAEGASFALTGTLAG